MQNQGLIQKDKIHIDHEKDAQINSLANKIETLVIQYYHKGVLTQTIKGLFEH